MSYRVELTAAAAKQLQKLEPGIRRRIEAALASLRDDPRPAGVKKLAGEDNAWRIRVGDYRAIYEIYDDVVVIVVFRVAHRRHAY